MLLGVVMISLAMLASLLLLGIGDGEERPGGDSLVGGNGADGDAARLELATGPALVSPDLIAERFGGAPEGGTVRLHGPGRLTGRVIERGSGQGLGGVAVELLPMPPVGAEVVAQVSRFIGAESDFSQRVRPVATAITAPDGAFAFEGIREGRWFLGASAPHHVLDVVVSARVLRSGDGGPVDVWMRSGGRIVGRVLTEAGGPVPGATVAMTTSSMGMLEAAADGEVAFLRTKADSDGRFEFAGVAPAEGYELAAMGRGIAVTHVLDLEVRAGEDTVVEVRGRSGARVRGRVLGVAAAGALDEQDAAGALMAPVVGAQVGALPRGLRNLKLAKDLLMSLHSVTDADGYYELNGVPPGAVDLLAMAKDHVPARGPLVQVPNAPGAEVQARDFVLVQGPKVRGRVVDVAGLPVPGARVLWNVIDIASVEGQPSLAPLFAAGMKDFRFPVTDVDGAFEAGPLGGRAPFEVRALKSGYEVGRAQWEPRTAPGEGAGGSLIEIVLHRGGSVSGRVLDDVTSEPVPSFTVASSARIESDSAAPSRFNPFAGGVEFESADGRFELREIARGQQEVVVTAHGYLPLRSELTVPEAGAVSGLEVRLVPGATLRGVVADSEGAPVAGARVTTESLIATSFERLEAGRTSIESALAVKGRPRQNLTPPVGLLRHLVALGFLGEGVATSAPDGSFEIVGLEPGSVEVLAYHRDFRAGGVVTKVERGAGNEPITITLSQGGGLRGKVTDRFGLPVSGAMVLAVSPGMAGGPTSNGGFHQARSRTDGTYEMLHMDGGPFLVVATRGDQDLSIMGFLGTLNFGLVNVPEDRVAVHHLVDTSASACRVTGQVTRGGVPVPQGMLLALNLESEGLLGLDFKAASIENDGTYVFEGLSPGEYEVKFEGAGPGGDFLLDVPDAPQLVHNIALPEGVVAGRFVARETGEPVMGVRVRLERLGRSAEAGLLSGLTSQLSRGMSTGLTGGGGRRDGARTTSRDGGFRFTGLDEGRYRLVLVADARSSDFAPPARLEVRVGENETVDVGDVVLDPGRVVTGRVVDEAGEGIEGAEVFATPDGVEGVKGRMPRPARSGADGGFEVRGLGPGSWRVRPSAPGFAAGRASVLEIDDEQEPDEMELTLARGLLVEVRVVDGNGLPRAGVTAFLQRVGEDAASGAPGGSQSFLARFFDGSSATDEDGLLALGRFEPGDFELRATQGFSSARRQVILAGTGTARLEITLK